MTSLQELGQLMFGRSDVARAHDYLSVALKNAVDCNVAMRILQTSKAMPYIESAHRAEINASRHRLYAIMAAMGVLVIILVVAWHTVRTKNMQLRGMASRLEQANSTKDVYIAQFLNLCSVYMDKLNQFNKVVNRKLSAGNINSRSPKNSSKSRPVSSTMCLTMPSYIYILPLSTKSIIFWLLTRGYRSSLARN